MITRIIQCDICGRQEAEQVQETGWRGWGAIHGVALNGAPNPSLCPVCLSKVMNFIDGGLNGVD